MIEGMDGAGTTTQTKGLALKLEKRIRKIKAFFYHAPSSSISPLEQIVNIIQIMGLQFRGYLLENAAFGISDHLSQERLSFDEFVAN